MTLGFLLCALCGSLCLCVKYFVSHKDTKKHKVQRIRNG